MAAVVLLPPVAAGTALAHVTVSSDAPVPGSPARLAFQVPNEDESAGTVRLDVQLPTDHPFASVEVVPQSGWTAEVRREDDRPAVVSWSGGRIEPGGTELFEVVVGPLPEVGALTFKAVQTYDSGRVVRWIEESRPGGRRPEHPAPVLRLAGPGVGPPPTEATDHPEPGGQPDGTSAAEPEVGPATAAGGGAGPLVAVAAAVAALVAAAVVAVAVRRRSGSRRGA